MAQQTVDIGDHFHKHSNAYQEVVSGINRELYQNVRKELEKYLHGRILDIGNGNVFNYDLNKLEEVIAVDVAFRDMKDTQKIKYFCGDARNLHMVKDNSCDYVVMQFLVHHIVEPSKKMTDNSMTQTLLECRRVLKPGSQLIIVEMLVSPFVEFIEELLYSLNYQLLTWIKKPMIKFYSRLGILSRLSKVNLILSNDFKISMGKWIDPFEALFPGKVKLPRFLYPAECQFIISEKPAH